MTRIYRRRIKVPHTLPTSIDLWRQHCSVNGLSSLQSHCWRSHLLASSYLSLYRESTIQVSSRRGRIPHRLMTLALGGRALAWLHEVASHESSSLKSVYIDTAAAINGVSRFGEIYRPNWTYVKDEDVDLDRDWFAFDYIISIKSLGKIPANKKRSIVKMGSSSGLNENDIGWWYLRFLVKAPELLVYNVTQKNG